MQNKLGHKRFLSQLSPETRRALCQQSDRPGLIRLGAQAGLILLLGWLIARGIEFWWLLLLPQGILIVFLFTLLHETIHRTAFRNDGLNDGIASVAGFLVFLGPQFFRYFHLAHHRHTHDPYNDPELESPKPRTLKDYAKYLSGIPDTLWRWKTVLRNAATDSNAAYIPARGRSRVRREAQIFSALYTTLAAASFFFDTSALLWTWLVPYFLGIPFLRAYLLAEHARCPHVADMLTNTRTTFTNRLIRWLAWNMPYHAEHHAYPAVPFHKLPEFHALAREHLCTTENGYARFNLSYALDAAADRLDTAP